MKKFLQNSSLLISLLSFSALATETPHHWDYGNDPEGPKEWAKLTPEFGACSGKNQTPINLDGFIEADLKPIKFAYNAGEQEIVNNGHTIMVNYQAGSHIVVDGIDFQLKQFHFHAPSENQITGKSFPMEGHFVHADKDGNLTVVAVMYKEGSANPAFDYLWKNMPSKAGDKVALDSKENVINLLPKDHAYYRFSGSLTTPPCTEGVRWIVMKHAVSVSKAQIEAFSKVMGHPNNRPLQPVNAREILK